MAEDKRALTVDWVLRSVLPRLFRARGFEVAAKSLDELPPIRTHEDAKAIRGQVLCVVEPVIKAMNVRHKTDAVQRLQKAIDACLGDWETTDIDTASAYAAHGVRGLGLLFEPDVAHIAHGGRLVPLHAIKGLNVGGYVPFELTKTGLAGAASTPDFGL